MVIVAEYIRNAKMCYCGWPKDLGDCWNKVEAYTSGSVTLLWPDW